MDPLTDIHQLAAQPGELILAIGTFDGLHIGHQRVIQHAVHQAASRPRARAGILTFNAHPLQLLAPERAPAPLDTPAQRRHAFADQGVHFCLSLDFSPEFASQAPAAFVERLLTAAPGLRSIVVGSDWRFGKDRQGTVELLARLGAQRGFTVSAIGAVALGSTPVRSTRIRQAVARGELALAHRLLGRPYAVAGTVVRGQGLGRKLGYPTANVAWANRIIPPTGVYLAEARLDQWPSWQWSGALVNLGFRPTVSGAHPGQPTLEAHLLEADEDCYDRCIEIRFLALLRHEQKFPDLAALRRQIDHDRAAALPLLARHRREGLARAG